MSGIVCGLTVGCFVMVAAVGFGQATVDSSQVTHELRSEQEALQQARIYTGFGDTASLAQTGSPEAKRINLAVDDTPFLHSLIAGHEIWQVTFKDVVIPYEGLDPDSLPQYARDFQVLLDAKTGRLLKITSVGPATSRWKYSLPASAQASEDYARKCSLAVTGLPTAQPAPLVKVLTKCPNTPFLAERIVAVYVDITTRDRVNPVPRWFISLRGIPPIPVFGGPENSVPIEQRTSIEIIANPINGTILASATSPIW